MDGEGGTMFDPEESAALLRNGERWEKLEAMQVLEELAKECRTAANAVIYKSASKAEWEKLKPWRTFRRKVGFELFNQMLDIAQGPTGTPLRDLAADILAHLWHPLAVDRLVEDLLDNGEKLLPTQFTAIFDNLAGIGNEPALRALLKLWDEGYETLAVYAIGACDSKEGEAFLLRQAREHKDPSLRGYCISALGAEPSDEKTAFLLSRLKSGTPFEQSAAVRKIGDIGLMSLTPELVALHNSTKDEYLKEEIFDTMRYMRKSHSKS
jgi:HEAT repeat protein